MPGLVEAAHVGPQVPAQLDVDAGGRLVEHQHRRRVHHRLRHQQPPPHAARQTAGVGVGLAGEADRRENLVGASLSLRHAVEAGLQLQQLARREERVEVELLRHDADRPARRAHFRVDVVAPDARLARGAHDQPGEDVDQRRLAGAVRSQQAEERALRHPQADRPSARARQAGRCAPDRSWPVRSSRRRSRGRNHASSPIASIHR